MKMNRISAKWRIAGGLVCLLASVLTIAMAVGVVPDRRHAAMESRARLCESVALSSFIFMSRNETQRLQLLLDNIVQRNQDLHSAALRRTDDSLAVEIGSHRQHWREGDAKSTSDSQLSVPIRAGHRVWGRLEFRFEPLTQPGIWGALQNPWVWMTLVIVTISFPVFGIYLGRVLQQLDPSKVVPGRVRAALDTLAEGLLVLDNRERIMLVNEAFARLLGNSPDEVMGKLASSLPWVDHTANDGRELPWLRSAQEKAPLAGVMLHLRDAAGSIRSLLANCSPVLGEDGSHRGVLVSFEDVTELEEKEIQLSESKAAAESANRAKSEFLARMSHEIRTPMNAILGFTDVLRRGMVETDEERQEYLDTVHSSGKHLLELINDVLDLSKVESGRLEVEQIATSPLTAVSTVIKVLSVRADEKGIALKHRIEGEIPESIQSDPVRLQQVLTNLVGNAIKFTEEGSVEIVTRFLPSPRAPKLVFDVIDSGIGMAPETLERIFDPFVQADTSITRRFGGTGLGLAISRRLARALGGDLTVTSELGRGSVFSVAIATGDSSGVKMLNSETAAELLRREQAAHSAQLKLPPARVLVVDDGDANRKLVQLVLSRAGCRVDAAENGRIGVEMALAATYDVIFMDMQMPEMDGYTATGVLRDAGQTLPIIALTGHAMRGAEEQCLQAGCSGFLTKPIDMDTLIRTMAEVLNVEVREETRVGTPASNQPPKLQPSSRPALLSSLPMDDEEFREIVEEFVSRLHQQLDAIDAARSNGDLTEIARLAHWLKGSGGTAGFDAYTEPARELELAAKSGQIEGIDAGIATLREIASRIVIPSPDTAVSH